MMLIAHGRHNENGWLNAVVPTMRRRTGGWDMEQFTSVSEQRDWSRARRGEGKTIGFVPTMGALHAGHRSLIDQAVAECDEVVVSIFVNPTQFDDIGDLEAYPKTLADDISLCQDAGDTAVYLPDQTAMYPDGYGTFVEVVGNLNDRLCAVARPGHFRGVVTVVTKLFNAVDPDVAYFGQKDLQQALIISRMADDLDFGVRIAVCPTVRDADGLALSSRNKRLDAAGRVKAVAVPRSLELARRAFNRGESDTNKLLEVTATELLMEPGVEVDYVELVSLSDFTEPAEATGDCVLALAAFVDGVRLIDHIHLGGDALPVAVDDA
ncbi:MAG: pantoate--beta-alanine ligase [Planctomycetota bacterium]